MKFVKLSLLNVEFVDMGEQNQNQQPVRQPKHVTYEKVTVIVLPVRHATRKPHRLVTTLQTKVVDIKKSIKKALPKPKEPQEPTQLMTPLPLPIPQQQRRFRRVKAKV